MSPTIEILKKTACDYRIGTHIHEGIIARVYHQENMPLFVFFNSADERIIIGYSKSIQ
jgi:hypothetical protein